MKRETIEQQAKSYTLAVFDELDDFSDVTQAYIDGAEWMQETMIEKACAWLKKCFYEQEHEYDYGYYITLETTFDELNDVIDDFRKAMEE